MKQILSLVLPLLLATAVRAAPVVSNISISQSADRRVKVDYTLSEAAIVDVEFLVNGESIGDEPLRTGFRGDAFAPVAAGNRSFTWDARKAWPNREEAAFTVRLTPRSPVFAPTWMVVDLTSAGDRARYYDRESLLIGGSHQDNAYKTTHLLFKRIPAAGVPWQYGLTKSDNARRGSRQLHPHAVLLTDDFYMGVYELTQAQALLCDSTIDFAFAGNPTCPAESISYEQLRGKTSEANWPTTRAIGGTSMIQTVRNHANQAIDLPTEAQWEFACRANIPTAIYTGAGFNFTAVTNALDQVAWYNLNSSNETQLATHPVGLKKPNGFGLYDMLGNVYELCLDWGATVLPDTPQVDPVGVEATATSGGKATVPGDTGSVGRAERGGAYSWREEYASAFYRNWTSATSASNATGARLCAPGTPTVMD